MGKGDLLWKCHCISLLEPILVLETQLQDLCRQGSQEEQNGLVVLDLSHRP